MGVILMLSLFKDLSSTVGENITTSHAGCVIGLVQLQYADKDVFSMCLVWFCTLCFPTHEKWGTSEYVPQSTQVHKTSS